MRLFTDHFLPWYNGMLTTESVSVKGFNYMQYRISTELKENRYLDYWNIAPFFNLHKARKHAVRQLEVLGKKQSCFAAPSLLLFALIPSVTSPYTTLQTRTHKPTKMSSSLISVSQNLQPCSCALSRPCRCAASPPNSLMFVRDFTWDLSELWQINSSNSA